ncbi:hypothetical protein [Massilia sp. METH4]|uniref:hypothetical protein n=1 Tax=Massilia sp. METH4 TaxID=3123041 RepID=UPI0030CCE975
MTSNLIHRSGTAGSSQDGDTVLASGGRSGYYAEAMQEADQRSVRKLFGGADDGKPGQEGGSGSGRSGQFAISEQDADKSAVRQIMASSAPQGAGAPQPELSGTGFTYRHNWGARRGQWTLRLNWGAVSPTSRILVSIGEGAAAGPDAGKFLGSARYTLHNVAPRAGGVDIWVNIEWSSDILLYVDYMVVNP